MKYRRLNGYANRGAIPGKPRLWQYPNEPALLERNTVAWMGMPTLVPSQVRGLVTCLRLALLTVALIFWLFNMKLCKECTAVSQNTRLSFASDDIERSTDPLNLIAEP